MPTKPSLSSSFSLLQSSAQQPNTPINWGAITVKPPTPSAFSIPMSPAVPQISMGMQTTTPSMIAPKAPTTPAVPSIGNLQSSDTALKPGQFGAGPFATVKADGTSTPSAYATSAPAVPTYTPPAPVKTASGVTVNPATGGVVAPPQPSASTQSSAPVVPAGDNTGNMAGAGSYSAAAGGAPSTYSGGSYNPLITSQENEDLFKKYMDSLKQSDEELGAQENLNRLNTSAAKSYTDIQNQPIALPFITGQQAAVQRSQALLAQPLESEIALLQAKRQISSTASKAALDRADALTKARRELATSTVSIPFGSTAAAFNSATGKFEPINGGASGGDSATVDSWVNLIKGGQAKLEDVPQQIRQGVAQGLSSSPSVSKANQDAIAQADTVIQQIGAIIDGGNINAATTGAGAYLANVKGTPAYNLAAQLDTIKSNVGFSALQAMRAASPTGGALGQVSEQENRLLQSTLASLDQGQGAEQLKANLAKVNMHFENLKKVLNAPINSQVSYDKAGNVIITAPKGAFNSTAPQSGSGSIYDW